jgi:ribose transport system substrate-binding protein
MCPHLLSEIGNFHFYFWRLIMFKPFLLFSCGVSLLALAGCNNTSGTSSTGTASTGTASTGTSASGSGAGGDKKLTIAVIPKGTTHTYWKSMEAGALKAGEELGVNIVYKGPLKESDRAAQIQIVQQFVSDGTAGIVLAPLDDTALVKPVKSAMDKKIPVVIVDSALKGTVGKDFTSFASTNNYQGGVLSGESLAKILGGKGKVVMLRYAEGSASTHEREEGFMSVMKKTPGITVTSANRYAGVTAGEAKTAALNMVDQLEAANGIYTPNESSTQGMLLALRQIGIAGKVKFVGFDSSPPLMEALNKGEINSLTVQNPTKMGYDGVKIAVAAIKGEKYEKNLDTGVKVVTKENLNTPEVKEVLNEGK